MQRHFRLPGASDNLTMAANRPQVNLPHNLLVGGAKFYGID
jgi:hypothetical protein